MQIIFHGSRGTAPVNALETQGFGGNTTSIEILTGQFRIIFDAGTGFKNINFEYENLKNVLLFSHFHHDHIQGLTSNPKIFDNTFKLTLTSDLCDADQLNKILFTYFGPPYFPIDLFNADGQIEIISFHETVDLLAPDIKLRSMLLNHPGGACGYSIQTLDKKIAILLDNEFFPLQTKQLTDFCKDSDIIVWDGTYTKAELYLKKGWGHSTIEQALEFSKYTNAKKIIVSHHSTERIDQQLNLLAALYEKSKLCFAYDGMVLDI